MPKTGVISVRMNLELLEKLNEYSEILHIRPSTIIALMLEDNLDEWVRDQSQRAFKKIWMKND